MIPIAPAKRRSRPAAPRTPRRPPRRRKQPETLRGNLAQVDLRKYAGIALACAVIGLAAKSMTSEFTARGPSGPEDVTHVGLKDVLADLHAAWRPEDRARILAAAPARMEQLAEPLRGLLQSPNAPPRTMLCAIDYAGAGAHPALLETLRTLSGPDAPLPYRVRAIRAAEHLEAWPLGRLEGWLEAEEPEIQVAALELIAGRDDAPLESALALLESEHPAVREAALGVITGEHAEAAGQALWQMVLLDSGAGLALVALGQAGLAKQYEAEIARKLVFFDDDTLWAALDCLATTRPPLGCAREVWMISSDEGRDLYVRARALYLLEQTHSTDLPALREQLFFLGPLLQHFAARCMLVDGDPRGVKVLGELADEDSADEDARTASRQLLAWLTGMAPTTPPEQLVERGIAALQKQRRPLPKPRLFL